MPEIEGAVMGMLSFETDDFRVWFDEGRFTAGGKVRRYEGISLLNPVWHATLGGEDQWKAWQRSCSDARRVIMKRQERNALWKDDFMAAAIMRVGHDTMQDHICLSFPNDPALATIFATAFAHGSPLSFGVNHLIRMFEQKDEAAATWHEDFTAGRDAVFSRDHPSVSMLPKVNVVQIGPAPVEPAKRRGFWG